MEESLEVLTIRTGTYFDAYWHLTSETDPAEALRLRAKQKMYLARYGRQSYIQWSDLEVTELDEAMRALSELISSENGMIDHLREDHG